MSEYDDIINMQHHVSLKHKHMPIADRAAQFAPFAALVGYDEAVRETARLTEEKIEQSEETLEELNLKLHRIIESIDTKPEVLITYFEKDERKQGGAYVTICARAVKVDEFKRTLLLDNKTELSLEAISAIDIK